MATDLASDMEDAPPASPARSALKGAKRATDGVPTSSPTSSPPAKEGRASEQSVVTPRRLLFSASAASSSLAIAGAAPRGPADPGAAADDAFWARMGNVLDARFNPMHDKIDKLAMDMDQMKAESAKLRIDFDEGMSDIEARMKCLADRIEYLEGLEARIEAKKKETPSWQAAAAAAGAGDEDPDIARQIIFGGLPRKLAAAQEDTITRVLAKVGIEGGTVITRGRRAAVVFVQFASPMARWAALKAITRARATERDLLPPGCWVKPCQPIAERERVRPVSRGVFLIKKLMEASPPGRDIDIEGSYRVGAEGIMCTNDGWNSELRLAAVDPAKGGAGLRFNEEVASRVFGQGFIGEFEKLFASLGGSTGDAS